MHKDVYYVVSCLQLEENKSSVRRYSAKYVVKQDHAGVSKRLFKTPVENLGHQTLSYNAEAFSRITSQDPVIQNLEEQKEIDSTKQVRPISYKAFMEDHVGKADL